MTEISTPWGGIITGDAGPYSDDDWSDIWRKLRQNDRTVQGVLDTYLNELEVAGAASPIQIDTGAGIVDGKFYENTVAVTVNIPTPSVSTRIDRIVLRKSWSAQTVRITRIAGAEGGAAPAITQVDGTTWDISLAQVSITTGGVITITDERQNLVTNIRAGGLNRIATELTIAAGVIAIRQMTHKLQPQSGTTDDLDTINGGIAGDILVLYASDVGTDTITLKHGTGNISCIGGSDIALSEGAALLLYNGTDWLAIGGSGGMTNSNISPTTANVTAAVNTRYFADVSGLTAPRNFVLPAGAVGDEIEISLTVGDDTYPLLIIGDTGITINGGSAATEWSRLFITGENVRLVANSVTNWQIVHDGRTPCSCRIQDNDAQAIANATSLTVNLDTEIFDNANLGEVANDRINIRRNNKYVISGALRLSGITAAANRFVVSFGDDAANILQVAEATAGNASSPGIALVTTTELVAGDWIVLKVYQNSGASQNTTIASNGAAHLEIVEVLA